MYCSASPAIDRHYSTHSKWVQIPAQKVFGSAVPFRQPRDSDRRYKAQPKPVQTPGWKSWCEHGFSILELLLVVMIIGIVVAIAIPQATQAVNSYKLHADAAGLAAQLNVARFRATSQFRPYALQVVMSGSPQTYYLAKLCGGDTTDTTNCYTSSTTHPYNSYFTLSTTSLPTGTQIANDTDGLQYLAYRNAFSTLPPSACSSVNPGTLSTNTGSTRFYFNTRGMPVDSSGNPLTNGGEVIYVTYPIPTSNGNPTGLTDAVVVEVGGRITVYQCSGGAWTRR